MAVALHDAADDALHIRFKVSDHGVALLIFSDFRQRDDGGIRGFYPAFWCLKKIFNPACFLNPSNSTGLKSG